MESCIEKLSPLDEEKITLIIKMNFVIINYCFSIYRLAVMKMKQDPETEDGKTVKKAASAWIETTVSHKKKGEGQQEGVEGGNSNNTDSDNKNSSEVMCSVNFEMMFVWFLLVNFEECFYRIQEIALLFSFSS